MLLAALLGAAGLSSARAQSYIGFVYPAGGRQGTTFVCTLGGQALDGVEGVVVAGPGVTGRIVEYNKKNEPAGDAGAPRTAHRAAADAGS
jgi:hypothetical protein